MKTSVAVPRIDPYSPVCLLCQSGYCQRCNEPGTCMCRECHPIVCAHCGEHEECQCQCSGCERPLVPGQECTRCHPRCARCDWDMSEPQIDEFGYAVLYHDSPVHGGLCALCEPDDDGYSQRDLEHIRTVMLGI